ncbi:MAG: cysteine desulfurase family protein [Gemmatimonadaceae bacterium]
MNGEIYLDYHATTPLDPRVLAVFVESLTHTFGNASSVDHTHGDRAAEVVADARREVAELMGARSNNVVFTSGATESVNIVLQGMALDRVERRNGPPLRVAATRVEHPAVLETCLGLERRGLASITWLPVDMCARLDLDAFEVACHRGLDIACIIAAHNEVGTIQPMQIIAEVAQRAGVPILFDTTQAAGRIPINFSALGEPYLVLSAHKMYGPKGIGAVVLPKDAPISPVMFGGGQQRGIRPGTLPVPSIAAFGEAARLRRAEMSIDEAGIGTLRDRLQMRLVEALPSLAVNGDTQHRLAGNLHVSVPGVHNSTVTARLRDHVALATGSACSSGVEAPSRSLREMGLPDEAVRGAFRLGLGKFTTDADVECAADLFIEAVMDVQAAMRAGARADSDVEL